MIETVLTGAAPAGFLMGVVFSAGIALYGRRRTLADVSLPKFVACGAVAVYGLARGATDGKQLGAGEVSGDLPSS